MVRSLESVDLSTARPRTSAFVARAWLVIGAAIAAHVCMAPLRRLTFDEAYYACAAARGVPWPIPHHPPLLGILLRAFAQAPVSPVELRVRLVPIVLSALTALGVARLAALVAPPPLRGQSFALGGVLASWGLMATAGGVQATPEAPLLAAVAWLLCIAASCVRRDGMRREVAVPALAILSACALASKVSALPCLIAVGWALLRRRAFSAAAAVAFGAAAALPYGVTSLVGQSAHALGRGPWVTTAHIGSAASLALGAVAVFLVFSPAALVLGVRSRDAFARMPGGAETIVLITIALVVSAVVAGRAPEIHWFAPASLPLYAAAAARLAGMANRARVPCVASHVAPAVIGVVVWCVPIRALERSSDFFVTAPHVATSPVDAGLPWTDDATHVRFIPRYGMASWSCLYTQRCSDLDRVLGEGRPTP